VLNKLRRSDGTHREELALLETLDTGKPIRHSLRDDIPGAPAPFAGMPKRG
jgi:gamma-glutamyl-gamma-aminobutyraldehyde dehydrogenase